MRLLAMILMLPVAAFAVTVEPLPVENGKCKIGSGVVA